VPVTLRVEALPEQIVAGVAETEAGSEERSLTVIKVLKQSEILQIPSSVLTRTAITPEMLEKQFFYKLIIRDVKDVMQKKELIDAMQSVTVRNYTETGDLRWGIIFYDTAGSRVGGIYFNGIGKIGAVGSTPVSFNGKLFKWLDINFSKSFR